MRPPEFTGGNAALGGIPRFNTPEFTGGFDAASMRPPEFTGGNPMPTDRFNERRRNSPAETVDVASMRPPEFTGGNCAAADRAAGHRPPVAACFNEAAGIHRRKLRGRRHRDR